MARSGPKPTWRESYLKIIYRLALCGLSDAEIAANLDVTHAQFKVWKRARPEITARLKRGRERASALVASRLLRSALGYRETVREERVTNQGTIVTITNEVVRQPNVTAQIFWLKNRARHLWYDQMAAPPVAATTPHATAKAVREAVKAIQQLEGIPDVHPTPPTSEEEA